VIPILLGITLVCFFITRVLPGGPVGQTIQKMMESTRSSMSPSEESREIEKLNKIYGFDEPAIIQYVHWLSRILTGDFGESFHTRGPVLSEIMERIPVSLIFGLTGFFLAYLICIPLGIAKALRHGSLFDRLSSIVVSIGYSAPGFALGVLFLVFLGGYSFLNLFPPGGIVSDNVEYLPLYMKMIDYIHHMILPVLCYAISGFAVLTSHMKNFLIEELGKDYIKTALARGLSFKKVVIRHALRNAFIPIFAGLGSFFNIFFAGSILIEKVFNIPGIGLLGYDAIIQRDYPVVLGLIIIQSFLNLAGRFISDISVVITDPRMRFD
jgi:microcin C transport system permease protein